MTQSIKGLAWPQARLAALAVTLGSAVVVVARVLWLPPAQPAPIAFEFVEQVPLANWQWVSSKPEKADPQDTMTLSGYRYEYRRPGMILEIETQYAQETEGNVSRLLNIYTEIRPASVTLASVYQNKIGFHSVFTYEGRTYLTSCLNLNGESTVTEAQFTKNRYLHDLSPGRVLFWVLGQKKLFDRQCLWVLMSLKPDALNATDTLTPQQAEAQLVAVWGDWYRWWYPRLSR